MNENPHSSDWISRLKSGDADAAAWVSQEFFERLVKAAHRKLDGIPRRARDEEDFALSALKSAVLGAQNGRFPKLHSSSDLWKLLVVITARKVSDYVAHETAQKRGAGKIRGESVFPHDSELAGRGIENGARSKEDPEFEAVFVDQLRALSQLLPDDASREIVKLKLANYSNQEIAERLACGLRSVERKLRLIRSIWSEKAGMRTDDS